MNTSLDLFLRRLRDPRWIPHISSYCDSRCTRCLFTERCWWYALREHAAGESQEEPAQALAAPEIESKPESQPLPGWAEHRRIDPNAIQPNPTDIRACELLEEKIDNDPLVVRARDYRLDVWRVMDTLLETPDRAKGTALPRDVTEALDDVRGLAVTIGAKVHRAVGSFEDEREEQTETDPVQNDANGSAKVGRLAITQSLAAWEIVQRAGVMDAWLAQYIVASLKQLEAELTMRFPLALAFVRPGFDEQIPGIVRPWSIMPEEDGNEDAESDE